MRMRFRKDEREAFTVGAEVEWRNGRYWYPGEIIKAPELTAGQVIWHVTVRHLGPTTKTISNGAIVHPTPGAVRVPDTN